MIVMNKTQTVDEYVASQPKEVQKILQKIRQVTKQTAPTAEEVISYGIPTYKLKGNLVHFGAFKNHIGFYPSPQAIEHFNVELSKYKQAKGSVQFPMNEEMPFELIKKIVEYRIAAML